MTKRKLSVTVAEDLARLLDRAAERAGTSRSRVLDLWLRRAATAELEDSLRVATIAYTLPPQCLQTLAVRGIAG